MFVPFTVIGDDEEVDGEIAVMVDALDIVSRETVCDAVHLPGVPVPDDWRIADIVTAFVPSVL